MYADKYSQKYGCQYIATLNENLLEGIKQAFKEYGSEGDYKKVEDAIVLELTDESLEKKLLGIGVNLSG